MNKKNLAIFVVAALLAVPATVSASQFTARKLDEQVVEGHTVFTVLQKRNIEQGFDIVIKVREVNRGPNVLWFNDQWKTFFEEVRQPCAGYVLATIAGADPSYLLFGRPLVSETVVDLDGLAPNPPSLTYVESYQITDPNGAVWITDLYAATGEIGRVIPIWISSVHNAQAPDDGISDCPGILDLAAHKDPGSNGVPYNDNVDSIPVREYNADIFGLWKDVLADPGASKEHGEGGADNGDGTGCEIRTEWECDVPPETDSVCPVLIVSCPVTVAAGDDDLEGNSHPYNPNEPDAGPIHEHETARIDVFFFSDFALGGALGGYPPASRTFAVFDTEVVESEIKPCDPTDPFNNILAGFHDHCP